QAAAELLDRGLRQEQTDPGALAALRREQAMPEPVSGDAGRNAGTPVLHQYLQVARTPAAIHLDLLAGSGIGRVVEQVQDCLAQAGVGGNFGRRLRASPAAGEPDSGA